MRSFFFCLSLSGLLAPAALFTPALAQSVPRAVLVEHFTNSRCSICASRNPGFYANLRQQPAGTLHVSYYPSAPYRLCVFSQANPTENDARTNFYGVYGSTPRLVVNGSVIPAAQSYADPVIFAAAQGQTAPLAVRVALARQGADSVAATVSVRTVGGVLPAVPLALYVALVEDTVFYAAPNGESQHYDVFRRSFTGVAPASCVPAPPGDSVTFRRVVALDIAWAAARLYAMALVQQAGGASGTALVQAGVAPHLNAGTLGMAPEAGAAPLLPYPNPVGETLRFAAPAGAAWAVLDPLGRVVARGLGAGTLAALDVRGLPAGAYVLRVSGRRPARFSKE